MKKCSRCGEDKQANKDYFTANARAKDGLRAYCKACQRKKDAVKRLKSGNRKPADPDYFKKWRQDNPGYMALWREANPDRLVLYRPAVLACNKKWRENNRERYLLQARATAEARRARKMAADDGTVTSAALTRCLERQKYRCWWCSRKLTRSHIDHRIPLSRGGEHTIANIVMSCSQCNVRKNSKMPWEMKANPRLL